MEDSDQEEEADFGESKEVDYMSESSSGKLSVTHFQSAYKTKSFWTLLDAF